MIRHPFRQKQIPPKRDLTLDPGRGLTLLCLQTLVNEEDADAIGALAGYHYRDYEQQQ